IKLNVNHLNDYRKLFNDNTLLINDVHQILYYLGDKTNYFDLLTNDLLFELLVCSFNFNLKGVSKTIYNNYKQIVNSDVFKKKLGQKLLKKRGYTNTNFNLSLFNYIYLNYTNTPIGKVIKIITVDDKTVCLSENHQVYICKRYKWYISDITFLIHDIIYYKRHYYFVASGDVYTGKFKKLNCYTYRARTQRFISSNLLYRLPNLNDIIQLKIIDKELYGINIDH